MNIRYETTKDIDAIWSLNTRAFPTNAEADLANALRSKTDCTSLVVEQNGNIVGHILFSPVVLEGHDNLDIVGLAPMAVLPEKQNSGIGSKLVVGGLAECKRKGIDAVVVLGHPNYYPRFGFKPSVGFGIKSEYDVPDDVFMALELTPGSLKDVTGIIKYHDAFKSV